MNKAGFVIVLILVFGLARGVLICQDYNYQATFMYESNDQGKILQQTSYQGWLILYKNGTYKLQFHLEDEGSYQYVKANPQQPNDTIYFYSKKNFRFFAYPRQNALEVWLHKTPAGANRWVHLELATPPSAVPPAGSMDSSGTTGLPGTQHINIGALIKNGVFVKKVIYGDTSMPVYHYYDRNTGDISADEKGLLFRPDGTYFLRVTLGTSVMEEAGPYRISGDQIQVVFSDKSSMILTLKDGGKSLHWYHQGMLISEYWFLGVIE
jgi:hypothetical protein